MPRRIAYPGPAYPEAWVQLPDEWLGAHLLRRDQALTALERYQADAILWQAALALVLADEWGGVPGIEGRDPARWDLGLTPVALLRWLVEAVFDDFAKAFVVPKVSSSRSGDGPKAAGTTRVADTAGN